MSDLKSDLKKERKIEFFILKPYHNVQELTKLFNDAPKEKELKDSYNIELEQIFSKKRESPKLLECKIYNLDEKTKIVYIGTSEQIMIKTIGNKYYYKKRINCFLVLEDDFWLIDTKLLGLMRDFNNQTPLLSEEYESFWKKIYEIIIKSSSIEKVSLKYIKENSAKFGRIESEKINANLEPYIHSYRALKPESYKQNYPEKKYNKITLNSFIPGKRKFNWSIDS